MTDLQQALAGAQRSAPQAQAARRAFVIGNVGRLGEELLNVLIESPRYARIAVAVRKPMRTVVAKLEPVVIPAAIDAWDAAAILRKLEPDDAFLCLEPAPASFWRIARPYVPIGSSQAVALARGLRAAGARRAAVLTPLEALLQLGDSSLLGNVDELAIAGAGFERLLILRPTAEDRAASAGSGFAALGALVVRILAGYMTPRSLQPVRARRAAEVAVEALATMANGVRVIGAARLHEIVGDPLEGRRAG